MVKLAVLFFLLWYSVVFANCDDCIYQGNIVELEHSFICSNLLSNSIFKTLRGRVDFLNPANDPIRLELKDVLFPSPKLCKNWFKVYVPLHDLTFKRVNIKEVEDDAFNTKELLSLRKLEFNEMFIRHLNAGMFNGLNNLQELKLDTVKLSTFDKNVFATLPNLEFVWITYCGHMKLTLDNLFGSSPLPKLKTLYIEYCDLKDTITATTFSGLTGIIKLKLYGANIHQIGGHSFDVVFKTLKWLNLQSNEFTSLDKDLFEAGTRVDTIDIHLGYNQLNCTCQLDPFREFIQTTKHFVFNNITCKYPRDLVLNKATSLCVAPEVNDGQNVTMQSEIETESYVSSTKPSPMYTPLIRIENGQLLIDGPDFSRDHNLIGFEQNSFENGEKITTKCLTKSDESRKLDIERDLKPNQMYRFCALEIRSKTVTPRDCISFNSTVVTEIELLSSDVWIMMDDQALSVSIFVLCPIFAFIIGLFAVFLLAKWNRWKFQRKIILIKEAALSEDQYEAVKRMRLSDRPLWRRFPSTKFNRPMNQMSAHVAAFGNFDKPEENLNGYLTLGDIPHLRDFPPPVPPRKIFTTDGMPRCCNSDVCECYCEL